MKNEEYVKELRRIANMSYDEIQQEKEDEYRKEIATAIVELFENLLDEKNIFIPCEDDESESMRLKENNDAKLYGIEYWNLIKDVESLLK